VRQPSGDTGPAVDPPRWPRSAIAHSSAMRLP
jgi:hypothetical protein